MNFNTGTNVPKNDEQILINCFYYSFYIKRSELEKYKIKPCNYNNNTNNLNFIINIDETIETNETNETNKNYFFNFSNVLDKYKVLEKLILTKTSSILYIFKNYILKQNFVK